LVGVRSVRQNTCSLHEFPLSPFYPPSLESVSRSATKKGPDKAGPFSRSLATGSEPHSVSYSLLPRRNVLVQPEKVLRVVAPLDGDQPLPCRSRVGVARARRAFVAEEVHVGSRIALAQRLRKRRHPRLPFLPLLWPLVEGSHVGHDAPLPVRERRRFNRDAGHCPTQHAELCNAHQCI